VFNKNFSEVHCLELPVEQSKVSCIAVNDQSHQLITGSLGGIKASHLLFTDTYCVMVTSRCSTIVNKCQTVELVVTRQLSPCHTILW